MVEKRGWVIGLTLLLLFASLVPMRGLYFDNSNEMWFVQGDPALTDYDELVEKFGDNEYVLVGIAAREEDPDIFTAQTFDIIYKLTEFLENHNFVTKVQSLTKYQVIRGEDDEMVVEDLVADSLEDFDGSEQAMQKAREIMAHETLAQGQLITKDLRHTLISARAEYIKGSTDHHVKLTRDLKKFIAEQEFEKYGYKIYLTGTPVVNEAFFAASMADQSLSLPLMFILIIAFLVFSFRTLAGATLPLLVIVGSVLLSVASISLFGWAMNMLNVVLPVILMAVGIGDSVHILIEFYHFRNQGENAKEAAKKATEMLFVPCLNTSITTMLGFLAISVSKLRPLNEFGVAASIGVGMAFILSVSILPAILSFSQGKANKARQISEDGFIARMTDRLTHYVFRHRKGIVGVCLLLVGLSLWSATRIVVDSNFINYFKEKNATRQDLEYFIQEYNGGVFLEYIFDSGRSASEEKSGGALEPALLTQIDAFATWLKQQPEVGNTFSMVDMLQQMNQAMHGNDPAYRILPDSRQLVAQYLLLYSNSGPDEDLSDMKTGDERYLRLSQRLDHMSSNKMLGFIERVKKKLASDFPQLQVTLTGMPVLYTDMDAYIHSGIIKSMTLAIISIAICFLVLLRSFKYGVLALIPSLFPIVLAAGLMGAMRVNLNFIAMVVASVAFGIAVDNSIHILSRYIKHRKREGRGRFDAMDTAVSETGRALAFTTMILFFGFSILMISTFIPNIYLGFFTGVILLMALIASLTLLPAVMFLFGDSPGKKSS